MGFGVQKNVVFVAFFDVFLLSKTQIRRKETKFLCVSLAQSVKNSTLREMSECFKKSLSHIFAERFDEHSSGSEAPLQ